MSKKWYGAVAETGDLSNDTIKQPFKPNKNILLRGVKMWVIVNGTPTLTGLKLNIKAKNGSIIGPLKSQSTNSWELADIKTLTHAIKEIYFEFNDPALAGAEEYYLTVSASSYTGDDTNYIAFVKAFDPAHDTDATFSTAKIPALPYRISVVAADL